MKSWLLTLLLIPASAVYAGDNGCAKAPKPVAACRVVHGRINAYNGAWSAVIWVVGTKHRLAVDSSAGGAGELFLPDNLPDFLENDVWGDFNVCPLSPEHKGEIQVVCVQSAKNLVTKKVE